MCLLLLEQILSAKMCLRLITVLLIMTVAAGQQLTLVQEPQSLQVNDKQEAILNCKFSGPAKECVWLKDGEITIVREPYQYLSDPNTGDCSIRINNVDLARDDGLWQCQYPRVGNAPAIRSTTAKVTVLVAPEDPVIYFEGSVIEKGDMLNLERPNENITVLCRVKNGNPAASLHWMIDNQRLEGSNKNETTQGTGNVNLYNTENQLILTGGAHLRGNQIKCIAEHPAYNNVLHESYGYFQVYHNTTQVTASVAGSATTSVIVEVNKEMTLYCLADGVPSPSYTWEFQRVGETTWETWGNQQNLTVQAVAGKFTCLAGNQYNIEMVRSPEEITVETKAPENRGNGGLTLTVNVIILVLSSITGLVTC